MAANDKQENFTSAISTASTATPPSKSSSNSILISVIVVAIAVLTGLLTYPTTLHKLYGFLLSYLYSFAPMLLFWKPRNTVLFLTVKQEEDDVYVLILVALTFILLGGGVVWYVYRTCDNDRRARAEKKQYQQEVQAWIKDLLETKSIAKREKEIKEKEIETKKDSSKKKTGKANVAERSQENSKKSIKENSKESKKDNE